MTAPESESSGRSVWRRPRIVSIAFWAYACLLFTATHWPKLVVPGPEGSDKIVHIGAFGTWTVCSALCGWFGRPLSTRNLLLNFVLSSAYAGLDELLQGFEFVHRSCEWNDFFANLAGVGTATIAMLLLRLMVPARLKELLGHEGR